MCLRLAKMYDMQYHSLDMIFLSRWLDFLCTWSVGRALYVGMCMHEGNIGTLSLCSCWEGGIVRGTPSPPPSLIFRLGPGRISEPDSRIIYVVVWQRMDMDASLDMGLEVKWARQRGSSNLTQYSRKPTACPSQPPLFPLPYSTELPVIDPRLPVL